MKCSKVRKLLSAYYDGELSTAASEAVARHVQGCAECTQALEVFKHLSALTAKWESVSPPASLWEELAPKLMAARKSFEPSPPDPRLDPRSGPMILPLRKSNPAEEDPAMYAPNRLELPHLLFVSQKVKDIKLRRNGELEKRMGVLRRLLHDRSFIPGDKVPATVNPQRVENGVVVAQLTGRFLSSDPHTRVHIEQDFPLLLGAHDGSLDVETLFSKAQGARVDDGGNIQNMIVNLALAVLYASDLIERPRLRITVASSSNPFARMPDDLAQGLRQVCDLYPLDIPDRIAIHAPWEEEGQAGTLAITSEPERTNEALERLIREQDDFRRAFHRATCFVSADPIYDQLAAYARPPFSMVINASTAFRALVAAESYCRAVLLPMNNDEAGDVCKLLLHRGLEEEMDRIQRPPFPSPFTPSGNEIDAEALTELNNSISLFMTYIPLRHPSLTCPITFGPNGGLLISAGQETIACFTSTPSPEGEKRLIEEFGDRQKVAMDHKYEVGAGDAAATIVSLFNTIDPRLFVGRPMEGREKEDRLLAELASAIFASTLSRIAGNFLIRTPQTNWSNIAKDAFSRLLTDAASESLQLARTMVKKVHGPVSGDLNKWGIKVVVWKPTAFPFGGRVISA